MNRIFAALVFAAALLLGSAAAAQVVPCRNQTKPVLQGLVIKTKPKGLKNDCGATGGDVLVEVIFYLRDQGHNPQAEPETWAVNDPAATKQFINALKASGWKLTKDHGSIRAGEYLAYLRFYSHPKHGLLVYAISPTEDTVFHHFVRLYPPRK